MAQLCRAESSQLRHVSTIGKNLLSSNMSSTLDDFNGFRVLAALLHGTPVLGVSQTLRRWTEGATCIRQGRHHVGHWPTF